MNKFDLELPLRNFNYKFCLFLFRHDKVKKWEKYQIIKKIRKDFFLLIIRDKLNVQKRSYIIPRVVDIVKTAGLPQR